MFIGFLLVSIMWAAMGYLYHEESWTWIKVCIIPWFFIIGFFIFPPYFSILTDVLTGFAVGSACGLLVPHFHRKNK